MSELPVQRFLLQVIAVLERIHDRRKDQLDVEEILKISVGLDLSYLKAWARRLEILDRLEGFLGPA